MKPLQLTLSVRAIFYSRIGSKYKKCLGSKIAYVEKLFNRTGFGVWVPRDWRLELPRWLRLEDSKCLENQDLKPHA